MRLRKSLERDLLITAALLSGSHFTFDKPLTVYTGTMMPVASGINQVNKAAT